MKTQELVGSSAIAFDRIRDLQSKKFNPEKGHSLEEMIDDITDYFDDPNNDDLVLRYLRLDVDKNEKTFIFRVVKE